MIIDCHTHLGAVQNKEVTVEDLLHSMDESNVDYSIILAERNASGKVASIESILQEIKKSPRLKAVVDCSFKTLDLEQITSITSLLAEEKVVGVKFYLGYEEYYPFNEKLFPIYEYCQEHGKPVIFHTGVLESESRGLLKYSHPFNVDEVAHLFPQLKIVMAHMGNPWLLDAAAVMMKNKYVYADMSAFFEENEPISHEDITTFTARMRDVKLFLGSYEKFLFGTDWPLYSQEEYIHAVEALDLTDKEKELIFWKNAKNIFNLDIK